MISHSTLLYVSRLAPGQHAGTVAGIAKQSRINNLADGICGLLVFDGTSFAQWLEGPAAAVGRLRQRICADNRHTDVAVLALEPTMGVTRYPNWSLGYASVVNEHVDIERLRAHHGAVALQMFQSLLPALELKVGDAVPLSVVLRRLTSDLRDLDDKSRGAIDQSRALLASLGGNSTAPKDLSPPPESSAAQR